MALLGGAQPLLAQSEAGASPGELTEKAEAKLAKEEDTAGVHGAEGGKDEEAQDVQAAQGLQPCLRPLETDPRVPAWNVSHVTVSFWGSVAKQLKQSQRVALDRELIAEMESTGELQIVATEDLRALIDQQARQELLGCKDDACSDDVQNLLQRTHTTHLLTFRVSRLAGDFDAQLTLFSSVNGAQVARKSLHAKSITKLEAKLSQSVAALLSEAGLLRASVGPGGWPWPKFHITLKVGNALSHLAQLDLNVFSYRTDLETDLYITHHALLFLVVGMTLGGQHSSQDADAVRFQLLPATFGAKRLWTFPRLRAWLGGGLGTGVLGLVQGGADKSFRSAFALTLLSGFDYRIYKFVSVGLEASTNLTDAIFGIGSGDVGVPIAVGLTAGISILFD